MQIEQRIPRVDEILGRWKRELGEDAAAYRNHVYRVLHFCRTNDGEDREKLLIAAAFHDLGIWSDRTFDYLGPSIERARSYLTAEGLDRWSDEIAQLIALHHRLRSHEHPLVDDFRRADLIDVSCGLLRFTWPRAYVREVQRHFPDRGFHLRLVQLTARWWMRHPLRPVPVLKW